jgi:hypothetical protein
MAEIFQYTITKTDSNPWLFSDNPVPEKYSAGQVALRSFVDDLRNLLDSVEVGENQLIFIKQCADKASLNKFILELGTLQIEKQFALDLADEYHTLEFTSSITQQ